MSRSIRFSISLLAVAAACSAQAGNFVVEAPAWGAAQRTAVAAAGGKVSYSHASGLAVVSSDAPDFLATLLASGAVTGGEPDMTVQQAPVQVVHVDAQDLAGVAVTDVLAPLQWALQAVQAPAAWAAGYKGKGVRVAVVDGGIWDDHPDLKANIDGASGRSFVYTYAAPGSCEGAWNCDTGTFWHATHVAGIIAAPLNGIGVVGIAPEATIVPVKVLHNGSGSMGAIIAGILYASTEGRADIINLSLGAVFHRRQPGIGRLLAYLGRAVEAAGRNGSLVVVAAGNNALDMDHTAQLTGQFSGADLVVAPAEAGNAVAVSATGPFGFGHGATNFTRFASYSNYGSSLVSVAGPGGDGAWPTSENCTIARANGVPLTRQCVLFDMVLSTSRSAYSWAAGTSMATPAVAAVAALIKQKYPRDSVGELKTRVLRATLDVGKRGRDPYYGKGFINAAKAIAD